MSKSTNLNLGVTLTADGKGLVGEVRLSKAELQKLKKAAQEAGDGLEKFDNKAENAGKKSRKAKGKIKGLAGEILSVKGVLASFGIGFSTAYIVKEIGRVARETENFKAILKTAVGDIAGAGLAFDRLNEFAKTTPYTLQASVQGFVQLKNLGLDPSERAMRSYGNTSAALGKSLSQMIEAVADASTYEFERLKEFGIKSKQHGDQVTFTFQGIETTVQKSAANIQDYLINIGETNFATAMADKVNTIDGQLSNLDQSFDDLWRNMGEGLGVTEAVKASLEAVASAVNAVTTKVKEFNRAQKVNQYADMIAEHERLKNVLNSYPKSIELFKKLPEHSKAMAKANEVNVKSFIKLSKELQSLGVDLGFVKNEVDETNEGTKKLTGTNTKFSDSYQKLVKSLKDELHALSLTAKEQFIFNQIKQLGAKATSVQISAITRHATALYDAQQALKAATEAEKELNDELDRAIKTQSEMETAYDARIQSNKDLVTSLQDELNLMQLSEQQRFVEIQLRKLSSEATDEQIARVKELATELYNQGQAAKDHVKRAKSELDPMAEAWKNSFKRIDDAAANMWRNLVENGKASMDDLSGMLKSWVAEMAHTLLTKPLLLNVQAAITGGMSGGGLFGNSSSPTGGIGIGDVKTGYDLATNGMSMFNGGMTGYAVNYGAAALSGASTVGGASSQAAMLAAQTAEFGTAGASMTASSLGSSMVSGVMTAIPYIAIAALIAGALGVFNDEEAPTRFNIRQGVYAPGELDKFLANEPRSAAVETPFGGLALGIQHTGEEGQLSDEQGEAFAKQMQTRLNAINELDKSIINALQISEESVQKIRTEIADFMATEDAGDLDAFLKNRYGKIADIAGGDFNAAFDVLEGKFEHIVPLAMTYATAMDEEKELLKALAVQYQNNAEKVLGAYTNFVAVNTIMGMLGTSTYELTTQGSAAADSLIEAAGGLQNLTSLTSFFFDNFYSDTEKLNYASRSYGEQINSLNEQYGLSLNASTASYKSQTLALLNNKDVADEAKIAYLQLGQTVVNIRTAEQKLTDERKRAAEEAQREFEALQARIAVMDELVDSLNGVTESERHLSNIVDLTAQYGLSAEITAGELAAHIDSVKAPTKQFTEDMQSLGGSILFVADKADEAAEKLAKAAAELGTSSQEIAERYNSELAIENLNTKWRQNVDGINTWLSGLSGEQAALLDGLKIDANNVADGDAQLTAITSVIKSNAELFGQDIVDTAQKLLNEWSTDAGRILDLKNIDEFGKPIKDKDVAKVETENPLIAAGKSLADSMRTNVEIYRDSMIQYNALLHGGFITQETFNRASKAAADTLTGDFKASIEKLTAEFEQSINAVANMRADIDNAQLSIKRGQIGWDEAGYQQSIINDLNAQLGSAAPAEQIEIVGKLKTAIVAKYNAQIDAEKSLFEQQKTRYQDLGQILDDIGGYIDNLKLSDLSTLTPAEKVREAQGQYSDVLLKAQAGDIDAQGQWKDKAQAYLQVARSHWGSSQQYQDIFDSVVTAGEMIGQDITQELNSSKYSDFENESIQVNNKIAGLEQAALDELGNLKGKLEGVENALRDEYAVKIAEFTTEFKTSIGSLIDSNDALASAIGGITTKAVETAAGPSATSSGSGNVSTTQFVTQAYADLFGKTPDAEGLAYWVNDINSGSMGRDGLYKAMAAAGRELGVEPLKQFAMGGISDRPAIFGEAGLEAAVPIPSGYIKARVYGVNNNNDAVVRAVNQLTKVVELSAKRQEKAEQDAERARKQMTARIDAQTKKIQELQEKDEKLQKRLAVQKKVSTDKVA